MQTAQDLVASAKRAGSCLSAKQAAERVKNPNTLLLDIREPAECESGVVPAAVQVPRGVLEFKINEICVDPDREILLHCAGGGRASLASQTLKSMGYTNVHIVDAQFDDLRDACSRD